MEYLIQILLLFILFGNVLKISFWRRWQAAVSGLICAAFTVATCRYTVLQSKTQLTEFMYNTKVMQDIAVLITIESMLCFGFCFMELRSMFDSETHGKLSIWRSLLQWYPGLLIFPVLFYLQTQLIFSMPGVSFNVLSYSLAASVLTGIPLLSYLIKRFFPEKDLRLEVYFLVNLFVCITGLIATVDGTTVYPAAAEPLNIKAIVSSLGLLGLFFVTGFLLNKLKKYRNGNYL
ncbi:MAG: hypothetical protein LBF05_03745 [Tannerella sp.]|jgi:hypothetical protein|nr:hypothetical protein [Tannerella sp.]